MKYSSNYVSPLIFPSLRAPKLCLLAGLLLLAGDLYNARGFDDTTARVPFHGPDVHPGYPDAFQLHYVLPKDTISPNGKFGLIFPGRALGETENDSVNDFVVSLEPSEILTRLDTAYPEFEGKSNGGYEIEWSPDSSVALLTLEARWGPGEFFLIEFQEEKVGRITNLDKKIQQLLEPDFRKAKVDPFNDSTKFIYEYPESQAPFCKLEKSNLVRIDAFVTNDPHGYNPWRARLRAVWDIRNAKFTEQHVSRLTNR